MAQMRKVLLQFGKFEPIYLQGFDIVEYQKLVVL